MTTTSQPIIAEAIDGAMKLLEDPKVERLCKKFAAWREIPESEALGFNAFTILSKRFYQEEFHSDVLGAFLDMRGAHGQGPLFLHQFLSLLQMKLKGAHGFKNLGPQSFPECKAEREKDRVDIRIVDASKKAIIIENKMYNAVDQPHQLPNYVGALKNQGYEVIAVVYLSLDGRKKPDMTGWTVDERRQVEPLLIHLAAFTNGREPDLYSHWAIPCAQRLSNVDALAIMRQYSRLLQYLGGASMDMAIMKEFYELMKKDPDKGKLAQGVHGMFNALPAYVFETIFEQFESRGFEPFMNVARYPRDNCIQFRELLYSGRQVCLDVYCSLGNFNVQIFFEGKILDTMLKELIEAAKLGEEFTPRGNETYYCCEQYTFPWQESQLVEFLNDMVLPRLREATTQKSHDVMARGLI